MSAQRSLLFYGEFSGDRVQIPVTCWLVKTTDTTILFDTGLSPRAVPGLLRNDPLARFTEEDLLVHRLDALGLQAGDVDVVVISHLHYDHAGGAEFFGKSELVVQQDEYAYAHHPAAFFAPFYYRKNFDLPDARWRLLDGDTELAPGVTVLRSDGHTPGHQSLYVELPQTGPVILAGDACYWQEHIDGERPPGVVIADGALDEAATSERRRQLLASRVTVQLVLTGDLDESRTRVVTLDTATARRLGVTCGDVVELLNPVGAPVRCWVGSVADGPSRRAGVSAITLGMLGLTARSLQDITLNTCT